MPHPELVQALLLPEAFPVEERPRQVELVETHVSWLFLTGAYVYKVKKPLDFGFLDFTTLEKRRHFCDQEVALNRRMSPEVYPGVVEIRRGPQGYAVQGPGELVEYAVKMRQLPRDSAMKELLRHGEVTPDMVRRLARKIWEFHRQADTSPEITQHGGLEAMRTNLLENFQQTRDFLGQTVSHEQFDRIAAYSHAFLDVRHALFRQREQDGRVRDCHGDLHTAQIFLPDGGVSIIDCIEFNERFRYSDVANDLAFLAMDLDYYGDDDFSHLLVETYIQESGDTGLLDVLDFYKCYRAYVRGKVTSFRLREPDLTLEVRGEVTDQARRYFDLAASYVRVKGPVLLITTGLMGTGKSFVARVLAKHVQARAISSDVVRKKLSGIPPAERRFEPWSQGLYSDEQSEEVYQELHDRAQALLQAGTSVVLDASYRKREWRRQAREIARRAGALFLAVECTAPDEVLHQRLDNRLQRQGLPTDGRWEIYHQQKESFEPLTELPAEEHLALDTSRPRDETLSLALAAVYRRFMAAPSSAPAPGGRRGAALARNRT